MDGIEGYELTERGKIIIAVALVFLLLVIPSAIIAFRTMSQPSEPSGDQGLSTPEQLPPIVSEEPPPDESGAYPPQSPDPQDPHQPPEQPEDIPPESQTRPEPPTEQLPPEYGPTGGDPSQGTLSFLFSPDLQDDLDDETMSMLSEFLQSPRNTPDSQILVELPQLERETMEKIVIAVNSALASYGVSVQRVAVVIDPNELPQGAFEVHLSFQQK